MKAELILKRPPMIGIRRSEIMEVGTAASVVLDVRLDDWRPTGNFALHQRGERLLTSLRLARNVTADIDQALAHVVVVQCLIQRVGKPVQYRSRHALRRKQRPPRQRLKFGQAGLYCSWAIR